MAISPLINVGVRDTQLSLNTALPANGASVVTGILDFSAIAPNSKAWQMGRLAIYVPALPANVAGGFTVTMSCAGASLTNSLPAPGAAVPGAFAAPAVAQVATVSPVAGTGSPAQVLYMTLAFDSTGSTFEFYKFTIAASFATNAENIEIAWVKDSN
jgi:hypothetical protein